MKRSAGIITIALGALLLMAGFMAPHLQVKGIAAFVMFIGLVIFGLSFIRQPAPAPNAPFSLSATERITGIFHEPSHIFKNLRYHPRWLCAFLVLAFFGTTYRVAFVQRVTPERIASEQADRFIESGRLQGRISPEEFKASSIEEAKSPVRRIAAVPGFVGGMLIYMFFLAGLYLLGSLIFGGHINYWQSLSVAVYGTLPPVVISSVVSLIVLYLQAPEDIDALKGSRGLERADLGILFSSVDHPQLFAAGSYIGLFSLYGWWLTANGLQNASTRISKTSAWMIVGILWSLGLIGVLALSALFPTFVQ